MKKKLSFKLIALAVAGVLVFSPLNAEAFGFKKWKEASTVKKVVVITASIVCTGAIIGLGIFYYKRNKMFKALALALAQAQVQHAQQAPQDQQTQDQHAQQARYQQDHAQQDNEPFDYVF